MEAYTMGKAGFHHFQNGLKQVGFGLRKPWLLVDAQDVACGIAEKGVDLVFVGVDGLDNRATCCADGLARCGNVRNHNMYNHARRSGWGAIRNPCAADLPNRVVEGGRSISALPDFPAKNLLIETS